MTKFHTDLKERREQMAPITNSVAEYVLGVHAKIVAEVETLKQDLEEELKNAKETLNKHYDEHRYKFIPEILQLNDTGRESILADLSEIKDAFKPIGQKVYQKIYDDVETLKQSDYYKELKEQLETVYAQGQLIRDDLPTVMEQLAPEFENLKNTIDRIVGIFRDIPMKN